MERGKNFYESDRQKFIGIISKFKDKIDTGRRPGSNKNKNEVWKEITQIYNAGTPHSGPRTVRQLRMLYKNIKRRNKVFDQSGELGVDFSQGIQSTFNGQDNSLANSDDSVNACDEDAVTTYAVTELCNPVIEGLGNNPDPITSSTNLNDPLISDDSDGNSGHTESNEPKCSKRAVDVYFEKLKLIQLQFENEVLRKELLSYEKTTKELERKETLKLMELKKEVVLLKKELLKQKINSCRIELENK